MKIINRIKSNEDFVTTIRKGKTLKTSSYVVHYLKNELNICRIGISCSKKMGNAVKRNRIKRQIRAMCDSNVEFNDHAFDVVVVVKKDFLNNDFHENTQILCKLFKEIGITK